ncbi:MAG: hypothetical protein EXR50_04610 [Dehalococcoidia bacterium]|nr:hypothetical protein [Dehalococcoidia bacterium]
MAMDPLDSIGPLDPTQLDDWLRRIIHTTSRLLLAQWEPGTPQAEKFNKYLAIAAHDTGAADAHVQNKSYDEAELTTEFYRLAFQDPEFMAMFRRCAAAAVYLETGIPPRRDLG